MRCNHILGWWQQLQDTGLDTVSSTRAREDIVRSTVPSKRRSEQAQSKPPFRGLCFGPGAVLAMTVLQGGDCAPDCVPDCALDCARECPTVLRTVLRTVLPAGDYAPDSACDCVLQSSFRTNCVAPSVLHLRPPADDVIVANILNVVSTRPTLDNGL